MYKLLLKDGRTEYSIEENATKARVKAEERGEKVLAVFPAISVAIPKSRDTYEIISRA